MATTDRILAFDIEASNLAANFGLLLSFGSKIVGKRGISVLNILDYMDEAGGDIIRAEKVLLMDVSEILLNAEVWLSHYGGRGRYDQNFLNTRLLYHRLPVLPPNHAHVDTWKVSARDLRLSNNRLNTISEFLETKGEKNKIKPEQWIRALGGHRPSMDYIVEHNRRDVQVLEEVYLRLRPLVTDHPKVGRGKCEACGSSHVNYHGLHLAQQRRYRRFQCMQCGKWGRDRKALP